jgi:Ca-activated chloride channel homolog
MKLCRQFLHIAAAATIVGTAHLPGSIKAQEPRPTFSARVALVPITATVRDSKRRLVRDLEQHDFQVLENNQPRPIVEFRSTDLGPVSLAVLLDTSGSMRGRNFELGTEVVDQLIDRLSEERDEVSLFTFNEGVRQDTPFTSDVSRIRKAIGDADAWGLTSIYDAIAEAAAQVGARQSQRRAVVVITDGLDTSSALTPVEVSSVASAIDVPVYVIAVEAPRGQRGVSGVKASDDLAQLARETGGDVKLVSTLEGSDKAIADVMTELRQQYFIAIEAASGAGWQRLDVTTKRRNLHVRARGGYFASRPSAKNLSRE